MATGDTLKADVNSLLLDAKRKGAIAVVQKVSDMTKSGAINGNRAAFPVLDAIRAEGEAFVLQMVPPYRSAISTRVKRDSAKAILRQGVEGYLASARTWGRSGPVFPDGRNEILDRDFPGVAEHLSNAIEREMRLVDAEQKPFWERRPVAIWISLAGLVVAIVGAAGGLLAHK